MTGGGWSSRKGRWKLILKYKAILAQERGGGSDKRGSRLLYKFILIWSLHTFPAFDQLLICFPADGCSDLWPPDGVFLAGLRWNQVSMLSFLDFSLHKYSSPSRSSESKISPTKLAAMGGLLELLDNDPSHFVGGTRLLRVRAMLMPAMQDNSDVKVTEALKVGLYSRTLKHHFVYYIQISVAQFEYP